MKRITVILLALLLPLLESAAQESSDTTAAAKPKQDVRAQQSTKGKRAFKGQKFIDEDGDGIADHIGGNGKPQLRWGKDRFIDNDGDGICDDRASGLGFRRGKTELRPGPGGPGSTGGSGTKGKGPGGRR